LPAVTPGARLMAVMLYKVPPSKISYRIIVVLGHLAGRHSGSGSGPRS